MILQGLFLYKNYQHSSSCFPFPGISGILAEFFSDLATIVL
jgi:hypothetical protein